MREDRRQIRGRQGWPMGTWAFQGEGDKRTQVAEGEEPAETCGVGTPLRSGDPP